MLKKPSVSLQLSLVFLALGTLSHGPVEAGIWDSIKSVFTGETTTEPTKIRVMVVQDAPSAVIEVKGHYNVYDPYTNSKLTSRFSSKASVAVATPTGIRWGEEFPGVFQIQIIPDDPKTTIVVDGVEYRGSIFIYDIGGEISIINEVPIESYVSSIMSSKLDHPLPPEAMNALAIALRTDAYQAAVNAENPFWHLAANESGYLGHGVTRNNYAVEQAVFATQHIVMSKSSIYRGAPSPIVARVAFAGDTKGGGRDSVIYIEEIEALAEKGQTADRILQRLFPDTQLASLVNQRQSMRDIAER
jgi:Stage II sporulation protein.